VASRKPREPYPLYRNARDRLRLASGRPLEDFTVENANAGDLGSADLGIHEQTLQQQAKVAEEAGFPQLARNLERAAELTRLPDGKILEIYEALRRAGRSTDALLALAREVEDSWGARRTADFIREAVGASPNVDV